MSFTDKRESLRDAKRWVIKVGSALLTDPTSGLNKELVHGLVAQIAQLKQSDDDVVLVSSGSIVEGMQRLSWASRPRALYQLQAAAAVGQMGLIQTYESAFKEHDLQTAQVLLTDADMANRSRYLNARSTLRALLDLRVVPVVNENDTVVTEEIRFGDNDTLAALVANLIEADVLLILTDQDGLYNKDPRMNSDATLISEAKAGDETLEKMAGPSGGLGRGGMLTKLQAAEKAARSGAATIIANGKANDILLHIKNGEAYGSLLLPNRERLAARKQWMAGQMKVRGQVVLDDGAVRVLRDSGRSLLPVGVTQVHGEFVRGELVACLDLQQREIARGLINYSSSETQKILGKPSGEIEKALGYVDEPELIHRDNIVVL